MSEEIIDYNLLEKELDRAKAKVFLGSNAAFLGSIMCSLNMVWSQETATAGTDGLNLLWNPVWFQMLPTETRGTVLLHELWHVARLHMIRRGERNPHIWNYACDIRINNDLEDAGYVFTGTQPWKDQNYSGWVEEDIYDDLVRREIKPPETGSWGSGEDDLAEEAGDSDPALMGIPVQAMHQAGLVGEEGALPGDIVEIIKQYLAPVVPWEQYLHQWFSDQLDSSYTWARPNRRYPDMYLPSTFDDDGRLEHLMYFLDCSGSITTSQIVRFNSEVRYVKDQYNPKKMTLVLFDTVIQKVFEITEDDPFDELEITGRGGTSLSCVRAHIEKEKPTAAIIFSDLEVAPMAPLTNPIPILWIAVGNPTATVPFGQLIHIRG